MTSPVESVAQLRAFLAVHPAVDERERASIESFGRELDRLEHPFFETSDIVHVTASALVIGVRGVILHRHKRLGIWIQPGGHIDEGEAPADAAVREVLEETGLSTTHFADSPLVVHVDVHPAPKGHTHLDLRFLLRGPDADPSPPEGESPDVRWLDFEEAGAVADAGLAGILRRLAGPFTIRRAVAADASAIAACYLDSFRQALPHVVRPHTDDETREWVRDHLLIDNDVFVAVHALGFVVGFVACSPGWIEQLYVEPAFFRRGVGAALLARAVEELRVRTEGSDVSLWTFQANLVAQGFYERHGFVAVERTDGSTNEEREPDVRYVLRSFERVLERSLTKGFT